MSWLPCGKKSSFLSVVIVLYLNYRPNSPQIDSDIREDQLIKNLELSLWWEVRSLFHQKNLKSLGICRRIESLVPPYPEKQEDLEGNSLACSGVGETWLPPQLRDKHRREFLILQTFEYRSKTWTKGNFRILSYRSSGYERSSRGCLGNLMERDKGGQEIGRQQKDMRHESLKPGF